MNKPLLLATLLGTGCGPDSLQGYESATPAFKHVVATECPRDESGQPIAGFEGDGPSPFNRGVGDSVRCVDSDGDGKVDSVQKAVYSLLGTHVSCIGRGDDKWNSEEGASCETPAAE